MLALKPLDISFGQLYLPSRYRHASNNDRITGRHWVKTLAGTV
jgi:hypothetical protein